ncbi:MAG: HAMP domain-containing histidine kinase [Oscillospiraceae bacterium]|nr:HAMP domain-containing histidine kinase [Oscillospiraceae bacterium]
MLNQLRIKFVAVVMLIATILVILLLSLLYHSTASHLRADNIEMMQSVNDFSPPNGFPPVVSGPDDRLHYFILSKTEYGDVIAIDNTGFDLTDPSTLERLYDYVSKQPEEVGVLRKYALRYLHVGTSRYDVYIFSDISEEIDILNHLQINITILGCVALCIIGVISRVLSRAIMHPVEQAWNAQKQFIADASHELKTPLTVITTNMDMLKSPDYTIVQKTELVHNISSMTARMRSLVDGLLDLARVDNGIIKTNSAALNYSELVEQSVLPFEPMFFESGRFLESDITPNIQLYGSEIHLAQVTDILLDNALKYSYEGSIIRLTLHRQGKYALLCVESSGDRISPDDLKNIFHRFYTVNKSRTGSSYGLGLSIAEAVVREHKGRIWAESSKGKNKFFVRLPL